MSDQNQNAKPNDNVGKLNELLGFNPAKRHPLGPKTGVLFQDTLKEIREEREKTAKAQAKDLLLKAMNIQEEWSKAEKQFNNQKAKFDKELGKLLNQINSMLNGSDPQPENSNSNEADAEPAGV